MHSFWTNTIYYIGLFATSVLTLVIIFTKTPERKKIVVFYFAVLGLTYWMEALLVLILNAYSYYPMITPDDRFFDTVLGNIFSQVSVSASAVLLCVLGLSNWWLLGFAVIYYILDMLFAGLGIYAHHWYHSIYTLAGFLIFARIVAYWYRTVIGSPSVKTFYPTLFLSVFGFASNLLNTALKLLDIRVFQSGIFPLDPSRDHTATALIYGPVLILISIALYRWKTRWYCKGFVFLLLLICQYGLIQLEVLRIQPGWQALVLPLDLAGYYGLTAVMYKSLAVQK